MKLDLGKWNKGSLDSVEDGFIYHFEEHGKEVGAKNITQYYNKALDFSQKLKRAKKLGYVKGHIPGVKRYAKNGLYIDIAPDHTIVSFGEWWERNEKMVSDTHRRHR